MNIKVDKSLIITSTSEYKSFNTTRIRKPPVVLVKTWLMLLESSELDEVKDRATIMLLSSFESIELAKEFVYYKY